MPDKDFECDECGDLNEIHGVLRHDDGAAPRVPYKGMGPVRHVKDEKALCDACCPVCPEYQDPDDSEEEENPEEESE